MRILFIVDSNSPFDVNHGGAQRSNLFLQAFCHIGHVDVISFCSIDAIPTEDYTIIHQENCLNHSLHENRFGKLRHLLTPWNPASLFSVNKYKQGIISGYVEKNDYDLIFIRYVPNAMQCGLWKYRNLSVVDIDDNPCVKFSNKMVQVKSYRNKVYYDLFSIAMKIALSRVCKNVLLTFVSNPNDKQYDKQIYLPNVPFYDIEVNKSKELPNRLIFVGDLTYLPNIKGLSHFLTHVFPKVTAEVPDMEIHVVGKFDDEEYANEWNKIKGVKVMGFVPALSAEYEEARIAVVPVYRGAGTCIKVLESLQMRTLCITTPMGFRGYESVLMPNEDCIIAQNDDEFARQIIYYSLHHAEREMVVRHACAKQQKYFTKASFIESVAHHLKDA